MEPAADEHVRRWDLALDLSWAALTGWGAGGPAPVRWSGPDGLLPAPFPVQDLAMGAVAAVACAASELATVRGVHVDVPLVEAQRVAAAFRGDQLLRLNGGAFDPFAPLSGFWPAYDGWVRTHANYPHHRDRLLAALGLTSVDGDDRDRVAAALRERRATEVEEAVLSGGGVAIAARPAASWDSTPQGRAVLRQPLVARTPSQATAGPPPVAAAAEGLPARGIRVLDLTRVIAGPVATRTLALLGADVLRVDPPEIPELRAQHLDTGFGKRSATLDLRTEQDRAAFDELLAGAHVVVTSYRPGALDRFGLDPGSLATRRPDLVVATVSAWGNEGPFARHRGFDSVVQAATGIALASVRADGTPGALPVQALDHVTGYITAAGVLLGIAGRLRSGGGVVLRTALARTAAWLREFPAGTGAGGPDDPVAEVDTAIVDTPSVHGTLRHPLPALRLPGGPASWASAPGRWGGDPPRWD